MAGRATSQRPARRGGVTQPAGSLAQLRVQLKHLQPAIWRRLIVSTTMTLAQLHRVLQIAMGWTDSHLHEFTIAGRRYAIADPNWLELGPTLDERRIRLASLPQSALRRFTYLYDFGDHWEHEVRLEKVLAAAPEITAPICTEGANCCPPEDVGGPPGYIQFLQAIRDPADEQHEEMLEWVGGAFDPFVFNIDLANRHLSTLNRSSSRR